MINCTDLKYTSLKTRALSATQHHLILDNLGNYGIHMFILQLNFHKSNVGKARSLYFNLKILVFT